MTTPTMPRGAAARKRLLHAAAEELVETGGLEVAAVARRAGVSAGLPYRYFGTRSGLLIAVVEAFYDRLDEACALRAYDAPSWAEREQQRIRDWVSFLYAEPLSPVVLNGLVGDGEVAAAQTRLLARLTELGSHNIARGQRDGELPTDRDPELLAAATLGGTHAIASVALARSPRPPASTIVDQVWAFIAGAVGLDRPRQA
jgi:AcrR family transcriptional regulator